MSNWFRAYVTLLIVLLIVYAVPSVAGVPTWPGVELPSTPLPRTVDSTTFALGYRPFRQFMTQNLDELRVPTWVPTQALGVPLIEQYEDQVLNPLEWVNWMGQDPWWTLVMCFELALAGLGIYLVAHEQAYLSMPASLAGALVYVLAGPASYFYMVTAFLTLLVPFPYILLFALSIVHNGTNPKRVAGLAVAGALMMLGGQPQIMFCQVLVVGLLVVLELASLPIPAGQRFLRGAFVLGSMVTSVFVAAPQVFPFLEDQLLGSAYSIHLLALTQSGWRTPPVNLLNPVSPFLQGPLRPWAVVPSLRLGAVEDFGLTFGAFGSFFVVVATWAVLRSAVRRDGVRSRHGRVLARNLVIVLSAGMAVVLLQSLTTFPVWPFPFVNVNRYSPMALMAIGALVVAVGVGCTGSLSASARWACATLVCLVPALGAVYLWRNVQPENITDMELVKHAALLTIVPLVGLLLALVALNQKRRPESSLVTAASVLVLAETSFLIRYGLHLNDDLYRLLPFLLLLVASYLLYTRRVMKALLFVGAAFTVFLVAWVPIGAAWRGGSAPSSQASVAFLQAHTNAPAHGGRMLGSAGFLYPNINMVYGIPSLASRNPVQSLAFTGYLYQFLRRSVLSDRQLSITSIMFEGVDPSPISTEADLGREPQNQISWAEYFAARPFFNLLGINYLVDSTNGPLVSTMRLLHVTDTELPIVYSEDCGNSNCISVRQDRQALPMAYFSGPYAIVPWTKDAWAARDWLNQHVATTIPDMPVVEIPERALERFDNVTLLPRQLQTKPEITPLNIKTFTANEVRVMSSSSHPGVVVVNDAYHQGWHAFVNGAERPVVRVNSVVRGVLVESGESDIRFVFDNGLLLNVVISGLSIMVLAIAVASAARLRRSRQLTAESFTSAGAKRIG